MDSQSSKSRFEGKVALITGAAGKRGMGRAAAFRLAQEGADIIINDVSQFGVRCTEDDQIENWQGLSSVQSEIRNLGRKALTIEADVTSSQQVETMVSKILTEFGEIDILVNAAGISGPTGTLLLETSDEDWNRVLSVNLTGTYLCCKAVGKTMIEREKEGKIINFSSVAGKRGYPKAGPHCASKFGVIALTQVLALELAPYKIYVNAVCPGWIATEMRGNIHIRGDVRRGISLEEATTKAYAEMLPQIPLGRAGQPEDVAKVVAFLASSDSDYMTGQCMDASGGFLIGH